MKIVRSASSAAGKYLTLDAVDIYGTIGAPPTRYQQTDTHIVKSGAWSNFTTTSASGGSYGRSLTSGASATITFTGTRLDWIAMKGTTTGYADVYLDGGQSAAATINLTAASASLPGGGLVHRHPLERRPHRADRSGRGQPERQIRHPRCRRHLGDAAVGSASAPPGEGVLCHHA